MRQQVRPRELVVGLALLAVLISLTATGHRALAVTVFVLAVAVDVAVSVRSRRAGLLRQDLLEQPPARATPVTHRSEQSVWLPHTPEEVWELIIPVENATLLVAHLKHAYQVPGTPSGVGEQQAFVDHDDRVTVLEVVELVTNRSCVAKLVSPPPPVPIRSIHTVAPSRGGSVLTLASEYEAKPWQVPSDEEAQGLRDYTDAYFARIRAHLAAPTRADPHRPA